MKNKLILIFSTLLLLSCNGNSQNDMIPFEQIEDMYSRMHANGINTDKEMLYGYFFTNEEPIKLEKISEELKKEKFRYVDLYQDEDSLYWLHLERIEIHNAKSLFELNKFLYDIADKYKVSSYDGFDVGNKDSNEPIERDTKIVPEEFKANDLIKENYPYLVIINTAFDRFPHKSDFKYLIELTIKYPIEDSSELPNEVEFEELDDFETFVETNLTQNQIQNYYIGRTTYRGVRNSFFVTNDKENAKGLLTFLGENSNKKEFEFTIIHEEKWERYESLKNELEK